ncbi:winged helix-turn-helix transcriptional regulator [Halegenticoccus soli]|uniref:winged helix-turn-helix transcriptional regulator n=1 Tax=Halegenticoccus soli TaxID=1985678 RepID=UPI000C6CE1F9|nr:helix-turn-helix domain-containing protein [Halegenticoccus soli]
MERSTYLRALVSVTVVLVLASAAAPAFAAAAQEEPHAADHAGHSGVDAIDAGGFDATVPGGFSATVPGGPQHGSATVAGSIAERNDGGTQLAPSSSTTDAFEYVLRGRLDDFNPTGVVLLLGYSRHDESSPLENDVRKRVYETIASAPGTYVSEIAERTDTPRSTVRYHIKVLERERLIFGEKIRGKQRFFPVGAERVELTAALDDDAAATVLDAVARLAPATVSEVASEVDRTPGTVSYHLSRLEEAGLIEQERDGGTVLNRLASDVRVDDGEPTVARIEATT